MRMGDAQHPSSCFLGDERDSARASESCMFLRKLVEEILKPGRSKCLALPHPEGLAAPVCSVWAPCLLPVCTVCASRVLHMDSVCAPCGLCVCSVWTRCVLHVCSGCAVWTPCELRVYSVFALCGPHVCSLWAPCLLHMDSMCAPSDSVCVVCGFCVCSE